jgi:endonuclease V-like protein UPF0215 family
LAGPDGGRTVTAAAARGKGGAPRPHLLGIDDGPFDKRRDAETPLVAVLTEGADRVEAVSVRSFPIDGAGLTEFLADWVAALPCRPGIHAVVLGGVTAAGLGIVDVPALAEATGLPVLVVTRRDPSRHKVADALQAAGLPERIPLVERAPRAFRIDDGLYAAVARASEADARAWIHSARDKSLLPEALRLAHLIATALVRGYSYGRA